MLEKFEEVKFRRSSLEVVQRANEIIDEYQSLGFRLTLRQLYYQFVARGYLPNKQLEYKRLGRIINDARMAGLVDWSAIEDRTRSVVSITSWENPGELVSDAAGWYREDLWRDQHYRPEVWVEKEALVGVFEGVCQELRLPLFACRGYTSQSLAYECGKRFEATNYGGQRPVVLHFGDHDPSGLDMTRDNQDRLSLFSRAYSSVDVRRLALNMAQVEEHQPPPNPAKETDSRFTTYADEHGYESWELDALNPSLLAQLVRDEVVYKLMNTVDWDVAEAKEASNREKLQQCSDSWEDVRRFLADRKEDEE